MLLVQCHVCKKEFKRIFSQCKRSKNLFCSHHCAAIFNNSKRAPERKCLNCGVILSNNNGPRKYCSIKCQRNDFSNIKIKLWKLGLESGLNSNGTVKPFVKRYLRATRGDCCEKCGWNKIHPDTHIIPLEANHIDGNWKNNIESNLELICPNCHSLTPNFRGLNKGSGRPQRL